MSLTDARSFALNADLDIADLAEKFRISSRVQIADFLTPASADALRSALEAEQRWKRVINGGDKTFEIEEKNYLAMPEQERAALQQAVMHAAATGFQFQYESIRVDDDADVRQRSDTLLDRFASFMSAPATLNLLRTITGASDIAFADAQATRYKAGDFLTRHDDDVAGKHRRLAYVMGLSPHWSAEWGGLLMFLDPRGDVRETMMPRFNTLNLFSVPQPHSVSAVAPYAPAPRLCVTGWLRARP